MKQYLGISIDCIEDHDEGKDKPVYLLPLVQNGSRAWDEEALPDEDSNSDVDGSRDSDQVDAPDPDDALRKDSGEERYAESDTVSNDSYKPASRDIIRGILLQKSSGVKGEFRRVGGFWFARRNKEYATFEKVLTGSGKEVAEEVCAEIVPNSEYPQQKYVITIV